MFFQQLKVDGAGCLSYMIGCAMDGKAFVVDPKRDVDEYLKIANANGLKIAGIIDTHVHADHISGAMELQAKTGAQAYIHENANVTYDHQKLKDGDCIEIGKVKIDIIHTPGHTPNSVTLAVTDKARGDVVQLLLTGDLLFVGSIGRPDLAGGELLDEQVANLYNSLYEKLEIFPDMVEVYPAHGAGSLCGSGMSAKLSSTLGFERETNPYFKLQFDTFTKMITASTPVRPRNFSNIISSNKQGPALVKKIMAPAKLDFDGLRDFVRQGKTVIDLRDASSFGGTHIPGSINIGLTPQSVNWLGITVDPKKEIVLLANNQGDIARAITSFQRAGYDNIIGFYIGIAQWVAKGEELGFLPQLSIHGLNRVLKKYDNHILIDVRTESEFISGHISQATHIPLVKLIEKGVPFENDEHITCICGSGYRSNIAASILKSKGYKHAYSVLGGMNAYKIKYDIV